MPLVRLSLLLGLVALAACDGANPPPPEPPPAGPSLGELAGTWSVTTEVEELYVVPGVDDEYPDFSVPGGGGIVVGGAVSDTLRYTRPFYEAPGGGISFRGVYSDRPLRVGGEGGTLLVHTSRRGIWSNLTAADASGGTQDYTFRSHGGSVRQPKDGRFTVDEYTLQGPGGQTVTIGGSLTVATRPVSAGDTVLFDTETIGLFPVTTYDVDSDGTVVRRVDCRPLPSRYESEGAVVGTAMSGTFVFADSADARGADNYCASRMPPRASYRLEDGVLTVTVSRTLRDCRQVYQLRGFTEWYRAEALPAVCETHLAGRFERDASN